MTPPPPPLPVRRLVHDDAVDPGAQRRLAAELRSVRNTFRNTSWDRSSASWLSPRSAARAGRPSAGGRSPAACTRLPQPATHCCTSAQSALAASDHARTLIGFTRSLPPWYTPAARDLTRTQLRPRSGPEFPRKLGPVGRDLDPSRQPARSCWPLAAGGAVPDLSASRPNANTGACCRRRQGAAAAGETYRAVEAFSGALAFRPNSMVAYLRRGEAYRAQRRDDEAIRDLARGHATGARRAAAARRAGRPVRCAGRLRPGRRLVWPGRRAAEGRRSVPALPPGAGPISGPASPGAAIDPLERAVARSDAQRARRTTCLALLYRDTEAPARRDVSRWRRR